ncbi:MAG: PKD domain-containing protein [Chloroflexota bacterium]
MIVAICLAFTFLIALMQLVVQAAVSSTPDRVTTTPVFFTSTILLPSGIPSRAHPVALTIEPQTGYIYVASTGRHEVVVIDDTTVIDTIKLSEDKLCLPEERPASGLFCLTDIEAHPVSGYVYVTQWQIDWHRVISGVQIVSAFQGLPGSRWNGPAALAVNPEDNTAYSGITFGQDRVGFICGMQPITETAIGSNPIALTATAHGALYVVERESNRVTLIENMGTCFAPELITTTIPVGQSPTTVAVHPQTGLVYVVNGGSGDVSVINGADVVATIPIGSGGWPLLGPAMSDGYIEYGSTQIIAFDPRNGYVYIPNWADGTVSVISDTVVIDTIPVGTNPNALVASPFDGRVYVNNTADDTVSVISDMTVITTIQVAAYPIETAVHPISGDVYIVGRDSDAVTVIHAPITIQLEATAFSGFETVTTTDTRVLATGQVTIAIHAAGLDVYNAASLRVYTQNDPGNPTRVRRGMIGQTVSTETIPIKVWTSNFGMGIDNDGDGLPDVDNDLNWKGNEQAVWSYIFDWNEPVSETMPPWNYPIFNYTDLYKWSHDPLPPTVALTLPVHFALAFEGKASPQVYQTEIIFEFAVSDDFGDTMIAYAASLPLDVLLQDVMPTVNLGLDASNLDQFPNLDIWPYRELGHVPLTLTLSAYGLYPYGAATIRVYTQNDPDDLTQDHMGMVGEQDRAWTVPIKIWTPNFGSGIDGNGDGIPDITDDSNWRDNEGAVWLFAFDWNQPVTETWWSTLPPADPFYDLNCAWCYPLFNYTDLFKWSDGHNRIDENGDYVYHLPQYLELVDRRPQAGTDQRVPMFIAADFTDALPQTYTTTLFIEFAFSADHGETVAQNQITAVTISATVPGDGNAVNWLLHRVDMRPDMDGITDTVKKLADSNQEALDSSDGGWTYDQALLVIALTAAGYYTEAQQILNGLQYMQNDDGSWFFSYLTNITDEMIATWATTDEFILYDDETDICLTTPILTDTNDYPDELEKRACWNVTHNLPPDQIGPWILGDYTNMLSPQTNTLLPDYIKYRTYDFRKYAGTNAWVVMAVAYYETLTGDTTYRSMAEESLAWLNSYREADPSSPAYGAVAMGRVWDMAVLTETLTTTYGFVNWPIYVAEHNIDSYAAFRSLGRLTGNVVYTETAETLKAFLLQELWGPHVNLTLHPELTDIDIDNFFFPAIKMSYPLTIPQGTLDTCIYLDGQSWSNLALGPYTAVLDKDGITATLGLALDYAHATMFVTNTTIFTGTGFMVTEIDGYRENVCSNEEGFVWSEGSEGIVAARYMAGGPDNIAAANIYHAETASYQMPDGGVPYTTLPPNPADPQWTWTDTSAIAGTAWFYFNERFPYINPFQPWSTPLSDVFLSGPAVGTMNVPHVFTATIFPLAATQPITFVWRATGVPQVVTQTGALTGTAVFVWPTPGIQVITVTVSNPFNTVVATQTVLVDEVITGLVVTTDQPTILGMPTTFTATLAAGSNVSYNWALPDGTQLGNTAVMAHIFADSGMYTVVATATNAVSQLTATTNITVYASIQAGFILSSNSGIAPFTAVFTNTSTGDFTDSLWSFGDGLTSTLDSPAHVYTDPGVYTVSLTVSGPGGTDWSSLANAITVYAPVQANFTAMPTNGFAPLVVQFSNTSTGDFDTCIWMLGDGSHSSLCNDVAHVYMTAGIYSASLTVSGDGGSDIQTKVNYIMIQHQLYLPTVLRNP